MKAKDKAIELIEKFNLDTGLMSTERKQCAVIAVDEIIQSGPSYPYDIQFDSMPHFRSLKYWQEVKQEIERLKL